MKFFTKISIFTFLFLSINLFAQHPNPMDNMGRMGGKIEQLEKIKIIEELNLDEETTLLFFAKRNQHRESQKALLDKRDELFESLSENFDSDEEIDYKSKLNEIFLIEREMLKQREEFLKSLNTILTPKQIVQLTVFEFNFRNEVRHQFLKLGRRKSLDRR